MKAASCLNTVRIKTKRTIDNNYNLVSKIVSHRASNSETTLCVSYVNKEKRL